MGNTTKKKTKQKLRETQTHNKKKNILNKSHKTQTKKTKKTNLKQTNHIV